MSAVQAQGPAMTEEPNRSKSADVLDLKTKQVDIDNSKNLLVAKKIVELSETTSEADTLTDVLRSLKIQSQENSAKLNRIIDVEVARRRKFDDGIVALNRDLNFDLKFHQKRLSGNHEETTTINSSNANIVTTDKNTELKKEQKRAFQERFAACVGDFNNALNCFMNIIRCYLSPINKLYIMLMLTSCIGLFMNVGWIITICFLQSLFNYLWSGWNELPTRDFDRKIAHLQFYVGLGSILVGLINGANSIVGLLFDKQYSNSTIN